MSRKRDERLGFVDYCRIDRHGEVHCYERAIDESKLAPVEVPLEKGSSKSRMLPGGQKWGGFKGSQMFTTTSKVHAPSWSMPMGAACPVIRVPVLELVNDMYENAKKKGRRITKQQAITKLLEKIPGKCLACYGMADNYPKEASQKAMARRFNWFNNAPEDEVVRKMVAAISKAGDEHCQRSTGKCTYTPMVPPSHFRLFDSGDFTSARDVKIWRKVAAHFDGKKGRPFVKFWAPTTAWATPCVPGVFEKRDHQALMAELRKLAAMPNVTVRPSEVAIDRPPKQIKGLGAGTAVVEKEYAKARGGKPRGTMQVCETDAKGREVNCQKTYVCPGNCGACKVCWTKSMPVVYVRHGLKPQPRNVLEIINRTVGTHVPPASANPRLYDESNELLQRQFVQAADVGPWGGRFEDGGMRLPKFQTRTREEVEKIKADIHKMKAQREIKRLEAKKG